jgi:hypothetical protein
MRRREQDEHQRDAAVSDGGMPVESEELLHAQLDAWPRLRCIVDGDAATGRGLEMRWQCALDLGAHRVGDERIEMIRRDLAQRCETGQMRRDVGGSQREVRMQHADTHDHRALGFRPWQAVGDVFRE